MFDSTSTATRAVSTLVGLAAILSVVAVGGIAQTAQENSPPPDADAEPNDEMATATPVEYGETLNGTLHSPSDVDYYAVNATAGNSLVSRLSLESTFEGSAIAVDIVTPTGTVATEIVNDQLSGPPYHLAGENRPNGAKNAAVAADVAESNSTYYVRVMESGGLAETDDSDTYSYNLTVTTEKLDQYEPNQHGASATPIEVGETVHAELPGYDTDVYAVNLTEGHRYDISFVSTESHQTQATLYANASNASDDSDDYTPGAPVNFWGGAESSQTSFVVPENGTYYIEFTESETNNELLERVNYTFDVTRSEERTVPPESLPADGDSDDDGLANGTELGLGTDPQDADTDGDGIDDGREVTECGSDPLDPDSPSVSA